MQTGKSAIGNEIFIVKSIKSRFTTVSRTWINDESLSYKAKGILLYLLDKPDDWHLRTEDIQNHGKEGRDAIRSGLRELRKAGYVTYIAANKSKGIDKSTYLVFEDPAENDTPDKLQAAEKKATENRKTGNPSLLQNTEKNQILNDNNSQNSEEPAEELIPDKTPDIVQAIWNNTCKSLPEATAMTRKRQDAVRKRWKELIKNGTGRPPLAAFTKLFEFIEQSEFYSGRSGKWLGCTFTWVLERQDRFLELLEKADAEKRRGPPPRKKITVLDGAAVDYSEPPTE